MATITLNNSSLKKYLDLFRSFDLPSRKKLIDGLNKNISEPEEEKTNKIASFFGAWEDDRDADEIIGDIKAARTSNPDIETF
ncbi:hypothetical protein [Flavobacterium psychrotrophum]|uniref:hypothetical protein n=1 Tax=Flavobacterium psychrotrophum TaxID=2294119 RepID=UPI000E31BA0E|nr:hypothetical protein [Flavobacterium psychrotrophum]